MAGGKGGSQTSSVEIPEYIEAAAQRNLNKAERISQLGYVPYYGPDVAAFTPMQQAAMQNVAGAAGAFGMATPQGQDIYGMPAPTTYAGGIQGYSSAPMFEQAQAELGMRRPAQKSYIDSFFIDPFTGQYAYQPTDYTQYQTSAAARRESDAADRQAMLMAEQMRMQGSALSAPQYNTYVTTIQEAINDTSYDPSIDVLTPEQQIMIQNNPAAQEAQDALYMNQLGGAATGLADIPDMLMGNEPSFENPSSTGSYGGSLVTGNLSGDFTPMVGLTGEIADSIISNVAPEYAMDKQTEQLAAAYGSTPKDDGGYNFDFTPAATPTNTALADKVAGFQTYTPTVGVPTPAPASANQQIAPVAGPSEIAYGGSLADETGLLYSNLTDDQVFDALESDPTLDPYINYGSDDNDSYTPVATTSSGATVIPTGATLATGTVLNKKDDPVVEVDGKLYNQSKAPKPAPAPSNDNGNDGGNDGGSSGCVVATHAVSAGAFTPSMKREAVVWCMHNLHDKWWGEAIRRGYRHLGRKKIEQGKAHEHYQEFRNYIDFASGKKRTIKGAIHFAARTVQFFAVGLVKGDA